MLAGMQPELFTHLADGPRDAATLAAVLNVAEDRLQRLLYAPVATGLLEQREGVFAAAPEAATYLVKGRPIYLGSMHELLSQLWHADLRTAQSIRSGEPAALHDFNAADGTLALEPASETVLNILPRRHEAGDSRDVDDVQALSSKCLDDALRLCHHVAHYLPGRFDIVHQSYALAGKKVH